MKVLQLLLLVGLTCSCLAAAVNERDICDRPCYLLYDPVCGSDGVTYPNNCMFQNARCRDPSLTSKPGRCSITETKRERCQRECYFLYDPVCGSDGVTYSNNCMFQNAKCRDPSLTLYPGPCVVRETKRYSCEVLCYLLYDPVCGSDGVTYLNHCMFQNARCIDPFLTSKFGPCSVWETQRDICDRPCYLLYDPVCGSDGVTYPNSCMFRNARCSNDLLTSKPGRCNGSKRSFLY